MQIKGKGKPKKVLAGLGIVFSLLLVVAFSLISLNAPLSENKIVVAIYQGRGANDSEPIETMFLWTGCTVRIIDANSINNGSLVDINILCVPGGNTWLYSEDISQEGKENIREFIRNGGAYFGICAGGYFASEREVWPWVPQTPLQYLGLFPGIAQGPVQEIASAGVSAQARVNIVNLTHPITQNGPNSLVMYYNSGSMFLPNEDANVTILGRYDMGNQPTIVAFEYGSGRAFIIGTHPEHSESSACWELMRRAALWLTEKQTQQ